MNANRLKLAVVALGALMVPAAHAVSGCSTSNLTGNYAMQFSGMPAPGVAASVGGIPVPVSISQAGSAGSANGAGASVPADGIVHLFLDGNGLLFGNSAISLSGMWLEGSISGQYAVNQDCSAQFTLTDPTGVTGNFAGVVVGQGETVFVLETDGGTGVGGVLKRTRGACQTADLAGTFGIQYSGSTTGAGGPYSSIGILTLDGQGDVSATESRFSGGVATTVNSNGSITVNPDCSAAISLTSTDAAAKTITFAGTVSVDNKQLLLVESDAGTAATGTLAAQ